MQYKILKLYVASKLIYLCLHSYVVSFEIRCSVSFIRYDWVCVYNTHRTSDVGEITNNKWYSATSWYWILWM